MNCKTGIYRITRFQSLMLFSVKRLAFLLDFSKGMMYIAVKTNFTP